MKGTTLAKRIEKIDNLIGIWRFRELNKKPVWCATFVIDGYYYDVYGTYSVIETLDMVEQKIAKAKSKNKIPNSQTTSNASKRKVGTRIK